MSDYQDLTTENARELLKNVEARNSQMLTIMHQYTNYIIIILAGVWTVFANVYLASLSKFSVTDKTALINETFSSYSLAKILLNPNFGLIIAFGITIIILISWRFYIHQIDNDFVQNYRKIIVFEKQLLGNPKEVPHTSTLYGLVSNVARIYPQLDENLEKYNKKSYDQQSDFIWNLIDNGIIGYRGQKIFDVLSGLFILFFTVFAVLLFLFLKNFSLDVVSFLGSVAILLIFGSIGIFFLFGCNPRQIFPEHQIDPSWNEIETILKSSTNKVSIKQNGYNRITIIKIIGITLFLAIIFYSLFSFGYYSGHHDAQIKDGQNLDEFFHNQYYYQIKSDGNVILDDYVNQTEKYDGTDASKLNKIASLISQDFSNPFWSDVVDSKGETHWENFFYGGDSGTKYKPFINKTIVTPQYWFEKRGKVRLNYIADNSIFWDPEWIAYQKTGGCQELSVLFNATTNNAGIKTRVVRSDGLYTTGHFWNEVNINGEWKFFDVQEYGLKKNSNDSTKWFGNTSDYGLIVSSSDPCQLTMYGVYVLDLQNGGYSKQPITENYDPNNMCPHGTRKNG